jgi:multisubunit Na+/H+ antiporter MnhE subunit
MISYIMACVALTVLWMIFIADKLTLKEVVKGLILSPVLLPFLIIVRLMWW